MKKKTLPEANVAAQNGPPHIGWWTPQKLGVMGTIAVVAIILAGQGGMSAGIALLLGGKPGLGAFGNACVFFVAGLLIATRRRWLQALGLGISLASVYANLTTPFFYVSVTNPQTFSGGGYQHFVIILTPQAILVLSWVAAWVTVVRNYWVTPPGRAWLMGACLMALGSVLALIPIGITNSLAPLDLKNLSGTINALLNDGHAFFVANLIPLLLTVVAVAAVSVLVMRDFRVILQRSFWFASFACGLVGVVIVLLFLGAISPALPVAALSFRPLQAPHIDPGPGVPRAFNMGMPNQPISVTQLQTPTNTGAHVDHFTLTAEATTLTLNNGVKMPAWTFNGTAPGPVLRVKQGDLVDVKLVNHLSFGVSIHWHGINLANAADGVAGLTQDAVKPGQTYEYRFIPPDAGTYWYHSHQFSDIETSNGLFGILIVDPATPSPIHADVDTQVALHTWTDTNGQVVYTMDTADNTGDATASTTGALVRRFKPGQWVRLRIVNTNETPSGRPLLVTLVGTPFKVISLDGHDLNNPGWLQNTPLPIGSAQRYDILFQIPAQGPVSLVTAGDTNPGTQASYLNGPAMLMGQGMLPKTLPAVGKWFDLTTYGTPAPASITPGSHFDVEYTMTLGFQQMGVSLGRSAPVYTINGKVAPYTDMLMVKEGQLVKLHIVNTTDLFHPIHIHGHTFTVLSKNGTPLTGSPVHVDTILVGPHETWDVAFLANNPGLWMLHCHNFQHADFGMDMMVEYYGISTPYTMGTDSGNFAD